MQYNLAKLYSLSSENIGDEKTRMNKSEQMQYNLDIIMENAILDYENIELKNKFIDSMFQNHL